MTDGAHGRVSLLPQGRQCALLRPQASLPESGIWLCGGHRPVHGCWRQTGAERRKNSGLREKRKKQ